MFTLTCGDLIYKTDNNTNTYAINQMRQILNGFLLKEYITDSQCKKIIVKMYIDGFFDETSIYYGETNYNTYFLPPITNILNFYRYKIEFNANSGINVVVIKMYSNDTGIFLRTIYGNFDGRYLRVNSLQGLYYGLPEVDEDDIIKRDRSITRPGMFDLDLILFKCFDVCLIELDVYKINSINSILNINHTMHEWYNLLQYANVILYPGEKFKVCIELFNKDWIIFRIEGESEKVKNDRRLYREYNGEEKTIWHANTELVDFKVIVGDYEKGKILTYGQTNTNINEGENKFLFILKKDFIKEGTSISIKINGDNNMDFYNIIIYKNCSFDKENFYFYPKANNSFPFFLIKKIENLNIILVILSQNQHLHHHLIMMIYFIVVLIYIKWEINHLKLI